MMEPVREKLEGRYPTALDEIMVTKSALKECGYEDLDVGDTLAMSYGTHEGIFTGTFRICGLLGRIWTQETVLCLERIL